MYRAKIEQRVFPHSPSLIWEKFTVEKAKKGALKGDALLLLGVKIWNCPHINMRICNLLLFFKLVTYKVK